MIGFGPHLTLDGYGCDRQRLADLQGIYRLLENMPARIGMTRIMPPYVFEYSGLRPEDWGVSGFVLIAESHISIHTFPDKEFVSIDIFSCKDFDVDYAIDQFKEAFGIQRFENRILNRGLEFPKNLEASVGLVHAQRREQLNDGSQLPQ